MQIEDLSEGMHAFDEVVAPLEVASGRLLNGPPRLLCRQAFEENPAGFHACVESALKRGQINPIGLLVRMVSDGDHRLVVRPNPTRTPVERARAWAASVGRSYPSEYVDDLLQSFGLDEQELAEVRAAIERSLGEAAA